MTKITDNLMPNAIDILEQDLKDSDDRIKTITEKNKIYKLIIKRKNDIIEYLNNKVNELEEDLENRGYQLQRSSEIIQELLDKLENLTKK